MLKRRVEFISRSVCRIQQHGCRTHAHTNIPGQSSPSHSILAAVKLFFHHWALCVTPRSKQQWNITWARVIKLLLAWPIGAKQDLTVTLMTGWLRAARRGRWAAQTSDHHRPNSPSGFHTTNIHPPASTPHNSVSPMLHETNKTVALTHKATQTWRQIGKQVQGP